MATDAGQGTSPGDVTRLLAAWSAGDPEAMEALAPLVYDELRKIAGAYMRRERSDHTLQPTAVVNEAFLRLAGQREVSFRSRAHFFGIAAQAMRRILVDHARARHAQKRGGPATLLPLDESVAAAGSRGIDLLALDEALSRLAALDGPQARVVELRFFAGLTVEETAAAMDLSPATVKRDWTSARAWLFRELA